MQIHDLNTGTPASGHYIAMDSGTDTYKATPGNVVPSYTSGDASSASSWTSVTAVATGLSFSTLINRITTMMKNVRYLYNILGSSTFSTVASTVTGAIGNTALGTTATTLSGAIAEHESDLGNTDISSIGNGTVTGAISTLNGKIESVRFNGTAGSVGAGNCVGTYDKASNTVRVVFHWSSNNAYASGTTLFTVPSGYRPSGLYNGSCYVYRSDLQITGLCTINANGQISQGAAATANGGFGVIEYPLA